MSSEGAKKIIAEVSSQDLDQWVRTDSFTAEVEEVRGTPCEISFSQKHTNVTAIKLNSSSPSAVIFTRS